ncbi:hypothetical protein [Encephalitozoon cuniculi GB-M1]|uniref:Uncharacterized protein n=2 Tax=Encephalitozoon cuniculi TaxID=6035 RepID=Q8SWD2_ENCCU|nr:uncharacterized protein ECU02_0830 [Encephalitozoon cuniculi GB-M1]AGE95630.1 hypothetical protein ECU02_0830 [Encephalitozoon cuniculi]KMV66601.1 hypothetical protein M970_020770 [Encephalitozoon cuniculi EcunIII-L]UYI28274.1 hypothetical protein J0A71_10g21780 [Encephalitozoon cuniculi]CAD25112.1 hypothetical protein [Encephalitozoon cuniculi GB-M1]
MSNHFCQEILALEEIIVELLGSERTEEVIDYKVRSLMAAKDRLNEKMVEMEEYYMKRIEFYKGRDEARLKELERHIEAYDEKYLRLLAKARKLGSKVERLEVGNRLLRSRSGGK